MPNAAILLIGDELLSGRTRDVNLQNIARFLAPLGIPVEESRIVSDRQEAVISAVNALRERYTYVFTTGGIGPTHDDITAAAIAKAFQVPLMENAEAIAILEPFYRQRGIELNAARRLMARTPEGARLIANPVSAAPGFQMGNVFTLAGVPSIVQAMLQDVAPRLETGAIVHSVTVRGPGGAEGQISEPLRTLADACPDIAFGSYPWFTSREDYGVNLVARSQDEGALEAITPDLIALFSGFGIKAYRLDTSD